MLRISEEIFNIPELRLPHFEQQEKCKILGDSPISATCVADEDASISRKPTGRRHVYDDMRTRLNSRY